MHTRCAGVHATGGCRNYLGEGEHARAIVGHEHGLLHLNIAAFGQPCHGSLCLRQRFEQAHHAGGDELVEGTAHRVRLADAVTQFAGVLGFEQFTHVQPVTPHTLAEQ